MTALTEKKPICLEQPWDQYVKDAERLVYLKKLIYVASRQLEVLKAHKRTGETIWKSTRGIDYDIQRAERIYNYLRNRARNKCIDIIPTI